MTQEFAYDVFLSHRSADKPRVRPIAERLRAAGLRVWFDDWIIQPGDDIYLAIEKGLEESRTLVLCLTRAAIESDWVGLERSSALFRDPGNKSRRFVPVLFEDLQLPDTLRRYRYIDYRRDDDAAFPQLLEACVASAGRTSTQADRPRADESGRPAGREASTEVGRPVEGDRPMRSSASVENPWERVVPYAVLAGGAFVAAVVILVLMLRSAETLVRLGLAGNLYYLVLVPLGLAVAAFLFGALKSQAAYTGRVVGGALELGGPIVGFLLVLILGFRLVPNPVPFPVTVFVHGLKGRQDLVLRNQGAVLLDLGGDRRREGIGDKGQAYFAGIPPSFRGQRVRMALDADGYESVSQDGEVRLDSESLYLAVRPRAGQLAGYVRGENGEPIPGATVSLAESSVTTDSLGYFRLPLSGDLATEGSTLRVSARGYVSWHSAVTAGGNEVVVLLQRGK